MYWQSTEYRSFGQNALFGEIITAQKVMYEKFGDNFLTQFVSKGFLAAHCSQDVAEQYRRKLQVRALLFLILF